MITSVGVVVLSHAAVLTLLKMLDFLPRV